MGKVYKIQDVSNIEEKILIAVYGDDWQQKAAHNEKAIMIDIVNCINDLRSELRAHRGNHEPLSK